MLIIGVMPTPPRMRTDALCICAVEDGADFEQSHSTGLVRLFRLERHLLGRERPPNPGDLGRRQGKAPASELDALPQWSSRNGLARRCEPVKGVLQAICRVALHARRLYCWPSPGDRRAHGRAPSCRRYPTRRATHLTTSSEVSSPTTLSSSETTGSWLTSSRAMSAAASITDALAEM